MPYLCCPIRPVVPATCADAGTVAITDVIGTVWVQTFPGERVFAALRTGNAVLT